MKKKPNMLQYCHTGEGRYPEPHKTRFLASRLWTPAFAGVTCFVAVLFLSGCSKFDGMFSDADLPPLKGERISILQLQQDLSPKIDLLKTPIVLPDAWTNEVWPQAGGYPNHAMGQLNLGAELKQAWSASIGAGGDRRDPLIAQPVAADGLIFTLDAEGQVTAFDVAQGRKKWRTSSAPPHENSGAIGGGLAVATGKLYVTNGYKQLLCLDPVTGMILWRVAIPAPALAAPTVLDNKVYLITLDNRLMVFSAADGSPLWSHAGVEQTTNLLGSASPAVDASTVVLALSSGEIFGLHVENGQIAWADNLSSVRRSGELSSIADIRGEPVIDQGVIYASSYSGRMVAIDEVSGQRIWQREIGSAEMPWVAGSSVFILSTEQQLICLTRQNGDIRWITSLPRFEGDDKENLTVWTGPVLAGGRLILASNKGQLAEINPADGKIIKQTTLPGNVTIAPVVVDNTLFLLTEKGDLLAYR